MRIGRKLLVGFSVLALGAATASADDMGNMRMSSHVAALEGGGTSTNTLTYNSKGLVTEYDIQIEGPVSFVSVASDPLDGGLAHSS